MSRAPVLTRLPDEVVRHLQGGQLCVVATLDEQGHPSTTLMSWVVARSPTALALCVDTRSRTHRHLAARPEVALEVLGDGVTWGVKGTASIAKTLMASTPFPCALVLVEVGEARDHASPGTVFHGPRYDYADDKGHRRESEERIFAELRGVT